MQRKKKQLKSVYVYTSHTNSAVRPWEVAENVASDPCVTKRKGNKVEQTIPFLHKTNKVVIQDKHRPPGMEM